MLAQIFMIVLNIIFLAVGMALLFNSTLTRKETDPETRRVKNVPYQIPYAPIAGSILVATTLYTITQIVF